MRLLLASTAFLLAFCSALCGPALAEAFIAPDGSTLHLKGISLGNWLMPEGYMFKFEVAKAPRQIYGAFDGLLGRERAASFWVAYRDTYIAEDDIRFIKQAGFNMVRIP